MLSSCSGSEAGGFYRGGSAKAEWHGSNVTIRAMRRGIGKVGQGGGYKCKAGAGAGGATRQRRARLGVDSLGAFAWVAAAHPSTA